MLRALRSLAALRLNGASSHDSGYKQCLHLYLHIMEMSSFDRDKKADRHWRVTFGEIR